MKQVLAALFLLVLHINTLSADIYFDINEYEDYSENVSISHITIEDNSFMALTAQPDFHLGNLAFGFDATVFFGDFVPSELQSITLRHMSYTIKDKFSAQWGRLQNVSFGQGLIMSGYDSSGFGSFAFGNEKAGFKGFGQYGAVRLDAMYTYTQVLATRLSYKFESSPILGSPVIIGFNYFEDRNGINEQIGNTRIIRPEQHAYSFDAALPIAGDFLVPYTEFATLMQGFDGDGEASSYSLGLRGDFFKQFTYKAEFRLIDAGFIPGYFDRNYEATFVDLAAAPDEQVQGFLLSSSYQFNPIFRAGLELESYDGIDTLVNTAIGIDNVGPLSAVANYKESVNGSDSSVLAGDLIYRRKEKFAYVVNFKRIAHPDGTKTESYGFSLRTDINQFVGRKLF